MNLTHNYYYIVIFSFVWITNAMLLSVKRKWTDKPSFVTKLQRRLSNTVRSCLKSTQISSSHFWFHAFLNIIVIHIVKDTVRGHHEDVVGLDLVLGVERSVWQLGTSTALVWKVEAELLFFRSEDLFKISVGVWSENDVARITEICGFDFVVVACIEFCHNNSTTTNILICNHAVYQYIL